VLWRRRCRWYADAAIRSACDSPCAGPGSKRCTAAGRPGQCCANHQRQPAGWVNVGDNYVFTPSATDVNGDSLKFSVSRLPKWAHFDSTNGQLTGKPTTDDVGNYSGIAIEVFDGKASAALAPFSVTVNKASGDSRPPPPATQANSAPTISGSPPATVTVGQSYRFAPSAADANGDRLSFTITNPPRWASFDRSTGLIAGTPSAADVGSYYGIVIEVSDGKLSKQLGPFAVIVNQIATGGATVTWVPPTENTDGTVLTDLAGYWVHYGTSAAELSRKVRITNSSVSRYFIDNLSAGKWYFGVSALNSKGVESSVSSLTSKTIG
jgi:uncharacterized protein (DUF2141 family)